MASTKYKTMLANRMEQEFSRWQTQQHVQERDVYRFLHTMKGTAGTIGLMDLSVFSGNQLEFYSEDSMALVPFQTLTPLMETFTALFTSDEPVLAAAVSSSENAAPKESFVLVIDADANFAAAVKETLEAQGISVVIALDGKKGLEFFNTLLPQMVIVDRNLPDTDGFDLVSQIHEAAKTRFLPIAVISADDRIENRIQAMEIGATDFIAKPVDMDFLTAYVRNRLRSQEAISQGTLYDGLTEAAQIIHKKDEKELKRHLNIVIVDDDSLVRKLITKQFAGWKPEEFDLHIAEYPEGASFVESDWYKPEENYMILLDGVMPKMDGLEVLNHVRSRYPHDNIIISMLTSRNNEADIVLALKSGADDYIVKPFYAQEVVARVQRLTKRMFK
ncbi:response regulator transcription factor [Planomicrobium okeanokoites]|uniref:Response regulator transcription factor n=1 Tax=Planomicrobium okeanokoites TaxID=244 RepID=A0ABV7KL53_PLAOK|nr:response regulator [Planomicrobium okeanokoites]TAA69409.1 response regulator [Planomicrobium okeanokoites]